MNKQKLAAGLGILTIVFTAVYSVRLTRGTPERIKMEPAKIHGNPNAPTYLVVFSDFACPYCNYIRPVLDYIVNKAFPGQLKLVFKHFPLTIHEHAILAAEASECAADQGKFWEMHDMIFENQFEKDNLFDNELYIGNAPALGEKLKSYATRLGMDSNQFGQCLDSGVKKEVVMQNRAEGKNYLISGTPTILLDGTKIITGLHNGINDATMSLIRAAIEKDAK